MILFIVSLGGILANRSFLVACYGMYMIMYVIFRILATVGNYSNNTIYYVLLHQIRHLL